MRWYGPRPWGHVRLNDAHQGWVGRGGAIGLRVGLADKVLKVGGNWLLTLVGLCNSF